MSSEKEVKTITDKQEIDKIIQEKIKDRKLVFTEWYKVGLLRKWERSFRKKVSKPLKNIFFK